METADQARILELLGRLLRKSGHLDQAIHHFSEAVELCPDNPKAYIDLGRCYQEQRQYDRGLHYLQNAISLAPEDPMAYYFAGLIFKEIKEYENAEIMFKKAADLAPDNLNIHRQLGAVTAINLIHNRQEEPNFIVETETVNHEKNS
jgi:tetratricopeptide (TPR) repeat protein